MVPRFRLQELRALQNNSKARLRTANSKLSTTQDKPGVLVVKVDIFDNAHFVEFLLSLTPQESSWAKESLLFISPQIDVTAFRNRDTESLCMDTPIDSADILILQKEQSEKRLQSQICTVNVDPQNGGVVLQASRKGLGALLI